MRVIIDAITTPNLWQLSEGPVSGELYADVPFQGASGNAILAGNYRKRDYFIPVTASVADGVLSLGAIECESTEDSPTNQLATYTMVVRPPKGNPVIFLSSFGIPVLGTGQLSFSWTTLMIHKNGVTPRRTDDTFSKQQILDLINNTVGSAVKANLNTYGILRLQDAPADSSDPVGVGANSYARTNRRGIGFASTDYATPADVTFVTKNDYGTTTNPGIGKSTVNRSPASGTTFVEATDSRFGSEVFLSQYSSLANAITGATGKQLAIDGITAPSSTANYSTSVLRFLNGGALNPSAGTLTLGVFTAPRVSIFGGAGAVAFSGQSSFFPEWFGVKGDAILLTDGAITNATNILSSSARPAVAADAGKSIIVAGAGSLSAVSGLNNALRTTVASVSGGNYILTASASATVSGANAIFGTDNTTAMQKMMNSLPAFSRVDFGGGRYMCGGVTGRSDIYLYAPRNTVIIYSTSSSVFTWTSKNNVTVDGITFDAGGNPIGNGGLTLVGALTTTNFQVWNCDFVDTFLTGNVAPVTTFNRHGVLCRDYTNFKVLNCRFANGLRVKGAGSGNGYGAEVGWNEFNTVNENGVSFLDNTTAGETWNVSIHHNKFNGIMTTGNCIVFGDDGSGVTQKNINFDISNNEFRGSLPAGTAFIQNRGAFLQKNIKIDNNLFINEGTSLSSTFAINSAQQTGTATSIINFSAIGNVALGYYGTATYRLSGINGGVISLNQAERDDNSGVGLRMGSLTNVIVSRNRLKGFSTGVYLVDGTLSGVVLENSMVQMANANNTVGIYIDTQTNPIASLTIKDNNVIGSGVANTNNYGIQDANNNNRKSDVVKYLRNDIYNIDTTSGLGSFKLRTLPAHAIVINAEANTSAVLTNNSATPSVQGVKTIYASNSGVTTITDFLNGYADQVIRVVFTNGNTTIQNNANLNLALVSGVGADFAGTANDVLTLVWGSGVWREVARSVN